MKAIALLVLASFFSLASFGQNCNADFNNSTSNLTANFTNTSTGGSSYYWDFGDGNTSFSANPSHTYNASGLYIVCLTISDTFCQDTWCDSVYVQSSGGGGGGCNADFTYSANNSTINFNNTSNGGVWYSWDFGDGNSSSSMSPSHTYASSGLYVVCLTISDSFCQDTYCDSVFIQGNGGGCNANFNYTGNNNTISFNNTSTGGVWYSWSFGDGNTSNSMNPTHTYANGGLYLVCLTISDSFCTDTYCDSVFIQSGGGNCDADFIYTSNGSTIDFNNTSTGGVWYSWDFGDGNTSSSMNPSHTYASNGLYIVCLTISDSFCTDTWCDSIFIQGNGGGGNCSAAFTPMQDTTGAGDTWYFVNNSTGNGLIYSWDFGDGNTSGQQNPFHTYQSVGTYLVCLTVTSQVDSTCQDTYCDSVTVLSVGQEELLLSNSLSLYPNPTNGVLNINLSASLATDAHLNVFSTVGQLVISEQLQLQAGPNNGTVDMSALPAGVYLVELQAGKQRIMKRVIRR